MKKFLFAATALALSLAMLTSCSSTETEQTQKEDMEGIITAEIPLDRPDDQTQDHDMSSIEVTEPVNDDPMNNARNHNLPLKDRTEDAKLEVESAMKVYLKKTYGDKFTEANITVNKIYSYDDEEAANLDGMNYENLAFEVTFDLKPASDSSENIDALKFTGGSYNEDSGWVEGNHGFGILEPNPGTSGYVIVSMAESF